MANINEQLTQAGIKVVNSNIVPVFSPVWYKGSGDSFNNWPQATPQQVGWVRGNGALNPVNSSIWSYISAPGMGHFDAQSTIESFQRFRSGLGVDPFLMFDLETTSSSVGSDLFHATEIAMAKYQTFGKRLGQLNLAVAPSAAKAERYRNLISKARAGGALTQEERYAIASFSRYAGEGTINKATNSIIRHNRSFAEEIEKVAKGHMNFTNAQIDLMEQGLNNLVNTGLPEHQVHTKVKDFFKNQGLIGQKFSIVGHNIEAFDLPGMSKIMGKEKWAELINTSNGNTNVIDTLNLFRMTHSNPTLLYKAAIREQVLEKYAGKTLNYRVRRQINREVSKRLRSLDLGNAGLLTMDSLRKLAGIEQPGHIGVLDIRHQADVFGMLYNPISDMIDKGHVSPDNRRPGIRRALKYSQDVMAPGQHYMAMEGLRGSGLDVAMDDSGSSVYNWVLNRRAVYEYEGIFQDGDMFLAKFYSKDLGRRAVITGSSVDEVRRKLQSGALQYIDPSNIGRLPQEQLEDLARQRINRWLGLDSSGYEGMKRAIQAINGDQDALSKLSFTELRDLNTLSGRLSSDKEALNMFIGKIENSDLKSYERTLALKHFYGQLNEEFPVAKKTVNRMWDPTVEIAGSKVSLRTEQFSSSLRNVLESQVRPNVVNKDASINYLFGQTLIDLRERGYINQDQMDYISGMDVPLHNKTAVLRDMMLAPGSKVVSENIAVEVESVTERLKQIDMARAEEIATNAIDMAKRQARAFQNKDYLVGLLQDLNATQRNRVVEGIDKVIRAYSAEGLGVHIAQINNRLTMYVHSGDRSTLEGVINSLGRGDIPRNALAVELPILSNYGNIIIGEERRINQLSLRHGFRQEDLYDQLIDRISNKYKAKEIAGYLNPINGPANLEKAQRAIRGTIHDALEKASGISRATTRDLFEESNRLDIRGTDSDILRRNQINVQGMASEFFGDSKKTWDRLSIDEQATFLRGFRDWALDKYGEDEKLKSMILKMTGEGVKEEKFRKGFFGLLSERDFTPFGLMSRSTRPNMVQWLNYYAYSTREIEDKLNALHYRTGIGINPYLVTKTEHAAYRELSSTADAASGLVKGVSIGALELSSRELVETIESERGKSILAKYGLTPSDVMTPGTWEQGVVGSPELRGLLDARQPKIFEIAADDIDKGRAAWSNSIKDWMATGAKSPLDLKEGSALFEEYIPHAGGRDTIRTAFEDLQGRLHSIEKYQNAEGKWMYRLNAEAVYPMAESTKVMFDARKGTLSYFGAPHATKEASAAWHELFGADTHLIYMSNVAKHQDYAANLKGQVALLAERMQSNPKALERLRYELEKSFGYAQMIQLPGRKDFTIEMADAMEMASTGKYTPAYFDTELKRIMGIFQKEGYISDSDLYVNLGGVKARKSVVELRRSNVNEVFRFSDYLGGGISSGAGLKIGPREVRSLRAKGMIIGANMDPIINYLTEEAAMAPRLGEKTKASEEMVRAVEYLAHPEKMQNLKRVQTLNSLTAIKGRDWFSEGELTGTVLDAKNGMFALELPTPINIQVAPGIAGARTIDAIPVSTQMIGQDAHGRIFLDKQARALSNIYSDIESYRSFSVEGIPHGDYSTRNDAYEGLMRHVNNYIDELARNTSSSEGSMMEKAIKTRMPASGRLKAQGISANLRLAENTSGTVYISKDLVSDMFAGANEEVLNRLTSKEGFYGILMRDPNEAAWNFQVMNYKVDPELRGRVARMSAAEAAMMGADFDGDQVGMLSPYSKRMESMLGESPQAFNELQMELAKIHGKQTKYNERVASYIRANWMSDAADQAPEDLLKAFKGAIDTDADIFGRSYLDNLMTAHLSKMGAGPLYNVAQRYGDIGQAIWQAIPEGAERAQRIELLNMFTEITTERFALKGKTSTPLDISQVQEFKADLAAGKNLANKWSRHFADAMSDNTALYWSGAESIIGGREISKDVLTEVKQALAPRILTNVEHVRTVADRVAPDYFKSIASKMFFSDQATAGDLDLVSMADHYLRISPDSDEYMRRFIPTDTMEMFASRTGQIDEYLHASQKFYDRLKLPALNKMNLAATLETADDVVKATGASAGVVQGISEAVGNTTSIWKRIPGWAKVGAAGVAGLAIAGSVFRKDPKPELVPTEKGYDTPGARLELSPIEVRQVNGQRITVKANNTRNVSLDDVGSGIKQHVSEGNVNIYQKDDTRSITNDWAEQLFTSAIKYGRGSSGTPNDY
jgi:hypothetical protein